MSSDPEQCTSEVKDQTIEASIVDISRTFMFGLSPIHMIGTNELPCFCGKEIATILGYSNHSEALKRHVDEEDKFDLQTLITKGVVKREYPEKLNQNDLSTVYITESGLYSLILKSKLKNAKDFKRWVTAEVLPSIRKTGGYHVNAEIQRLTSELSAQRLLVNNAANIVEEQKTLAEEARMKAEAEQKRADDARAEVERIRQEKEAADIKHKEEVAALELTSLKIREAHKEQLNQRTEHIYVFSNDKHKSNDVYKVGRTKNHPDGRVSTLNTALPINDSLYIVSTYTCANAHAAECLIHAMLAPFRESPSREFFRIKFRLLHTAITNVIAHQNEDFLYSACTIVDEVIGVPGASGKDADEYMVAIAAANAASIIPIITNEMLAQEAITTWIATLPTPPEKFDWIKFQVFLRSFLEARRRYSKATYRAREWKDMSAAAFMRAVNPR